MRIRRPLRWLLVLAVVLLVAVAWRATHEPESLRGLADHRAPIGQIEPSQPTEEGRPAAAVAYGHEQAERRAQVIDLDRARRDALRERILEREQQVAARRHDEATRREADADEVPAEGPGLVDRIGGRDALLTALNRDFLPLADECIEQASARNPTLRGLLEIEIDLVADPELGAVIDAADYPVSNQIHETELLECIRETALATALPPPPEGGREGFMISMHVGEDS